LSLTVPSVSVSIGGTTYTPTNRLKKFYCTDQDLTYGIGQFEVEIADPDGSAASKYTTFGTEKGLMNEVKIVVDGATIFDGYIESVEFSYSRGDSIILTGYSKALDFMNVFITKDYSSWVGISASTFLLDVFTLAGRTFPHILGYNLASHSPPYPSAVASPGALSQKYVHDIIREVCSGTKFAASVDPAGYFYYFNPSDGLHNINYAVESVYPSNPLSPNDLKEGRATRNLQDTKNYLEVNGAGQGYDPFCTNGGLTNPAYNDPLSGGIMQWSTSYPATVQTTTDAPNLSSSITIDHSIQVIPDPTHRPVGVMYAGFGFGPPINVLGRGNVQNLAWGTSANAYQIKNDIDDSHYWVDASFNAKSGIHLYAKGQGTLTENAGKVWPVLTDIFGNTATANGLNNGNPATWPVPQTGVWSEYNFPVPTSSDLSLNGNGYYRFADYAGNPITTGFNFSTIVDLEFSFTAYGTAHGASYWTMLELAGVWFTCTPQYFVPTKVVAAAGVPYGRRDQAVNAGSQYVNQIDVQGYGDGIYPQYQNPMLRVPITVLVDPGLADRFFKAGWLIGLNIPRWGFTPQIMPSWRILQVRWDWSTAGLTTKLDVIPATAG
jgi:hypothetical protein